MIIMDDGVLKKTFDDFQMICEMGGAYPETPEFRHITTKIPGQLGLIKVGVENNSESFSFPLFLNERDLSYRRKILNDLKEFLFDDLGNPKEINIIFLDEPDKFFKVECSSQISINKILPGSRFDLEFVSHGPLKYSIVNADEITWGSTEITFESTTYTYGHEGVDSSFNIKSATTKKIDVIGLALQPQISLWGSATNLVITNQGKKITVGTFANKLWEIDCEKYIAYQDGVEKMIPMDKFMLRKGVNNVQFSGTDMDIDVTIKFRDRWK